MTALDPYEHAVDRFEAGCEAGICDGAASASQIVLGTGMTKSSGYRALGALEENGFLSRDVNGDYLRGEVAWQIGLSAWGFGGGLNGVLPLVCYLRTQTRRTACVCVVSSGVFHVGPFSLARGSDHIHPSRSSSPFWAHSETPDFLDLDFNAGQISAVWAPTSSGKAPSVAGFAVLTRGISPSRRIELVKHVPAVAHMARASSALGSRQI